MASESQSLAHLSHEWITSKEQLAVEQSAWDAVVDENYQGNPFLSAKWYLLWLEHFAQEPTKVCFTKILYRGKPVAYFPLIQQSERFHGLPVEALRFAGNIYSPINTPIVAKGTRSEVFKYFVREVLPGFRWSVFLSGDLPMEHIGPAELHVALLEAGYRSYLSPSEGNWIFDEPGMTSDRYLQSRDSTTRNHIRRLPKKLEKIARTQFRVVKDSLTEPDVEAYQRVYAQSWKEAEIDQRFHPRLMELAASKGLLRLFFLYLRDRPIATQMWLLHGDRGYPVKFAYDEAYRAHSPGNVIMWRALQYVLDQEGVGYLDFGKGDDDYKKYWTNQRRQRLSLLCFAKTWRAAPLRGLDQTVLPAVRRIRALNALKRFVARRVFGSGGES